MVPDFASPSPPVAGERASLTRRKGVAGGAGSDAVARYPDSLGVAQFADRGAQG